MILNRVTWLIVLVAFLCGCRGDLKTRDRGEDAQMVSAAIRAVAANDLKQVTAMFCYPDESVARVESENLVAQLEILQRDFGKVRFLRSYRGVPDSHFVGVGGGTTEFWNAHAGASRYTFAVEFGKQGSGWVFIDVTDSCGAPKIKMLAYALPSDRAGSAAFMAQETIKMARFLIQSR